MHSKLRSEGDTIARSGPIEKRLEIGGLCVDLPDGSTQCTVKRLCVDGPQCVSRTFVQIAERGYLVESYATNECYQ